MIKIPTVLVLGAGASTDYGYPTGPKLRDIILDRFVGLEHQLTLVDADCLGMFHHHFSFE